MADTLTWPFALVLGAVFGLTTYKISFLSASGSVAGGLFAASLLALGGLPWITPSFTFFFLSSLLSKVRSKRRSQAEEHYEKGSVRDAGQVLANGGVGWVLLLAHAAWPSPVFYWGFVGAFAAATADTWGTEIGGLSPFPPRLITRWRPVAPGTSGAVSAYGLAGGFAGAAVIWLSTWPFTEGVAGSMAGWIGAATVVGSGLGGSLLDSFVGATVQAQYVDPATGEVTERHRNERGARVLVRGWRWVRNDVVNLACTLAGSCLAMLFFVLIYGSM